MLALKGKAEVLHTNGHVFRSEALIIQAPSVVRLNYFVKVPYRARASLSRRAVLVRDHFECQYCGRPAENVLAPAGRVVRSGSALLVLLLAFVEGAVLLGALTLLPAAVAATGAGSTLAGAVTAVYGIAVFVFARLTGRMSRRWPAWRPIAVGAVAAVAGCALAAVSRQAVVAAGVAVLMGLAWAAMHSSLQTWATQVLPSARATVVSLFAGSLFAGSALASALIAGPADAGRFGFAFAGMAVVCVPLGVLATVGRARWREPALVGGGR